MLLTLLPNIQYVKADTGIQDKVTSVDVSKVESEVNKELGIEVSNELKINIEKETDEKVVVNTTLETTDLSVSTDIDMNLETGELLYSVRRLMKMVKKPNKTLMFMYKKLKEMTL